MRILPKILGACAIAALAATAAWAAAKPVQHRMTVWLPGGGSEVITYTGDVAPKLSFTPSEFTAEPAFWSPLAFGAPAVPPDRIALAMNSLAMDNDMASMIRAADAMMAMPLASGVTEANLNALPPGSESYSMVSTVNGNAVCSRSVQITRTGHGQPKVVRHASGNCAGAPDDSVLFQAAPSGHDGGLTAIGTKTALRAPAYPHI